MAWYFSPLIVDSFDDRRGQHIGNYKKPNLGAGTQTPPGRSHRKET